MPDVKFEPVSFSGELKEDALNNIVDEVQGCKHPPKGIRNALRTVTQCLGIDTPITFPKRILGVADALNSALFD